MKLLTITRIALASVAAVALSSCSLGESADSGATTQTSAPVSASPSQTSAAETSASEETSAAEETSATESSEPAETGASSEAQDACAALTTDEVNASLGTKVGKGTASTTGSLSQCQYVDSSNATGVVTQIMEVPFEQYVTAMEQQLGKDAKTETVTVSGADKASLITGTVGGPAAAILAKKGDLTYTVIVVAATSPSAPKSDAMVKAAAAMLA